MALRKLLRQGRGAGVRAALDAGGSASVDVLDCVLNDPRWDRQVEARDEYYARLLGTETDIDVLGRHVIQGGNEADEADLWLPIGVLAQMTRRGANSARRAMSEAVRDGACWRACLDALDAAGGADLVDLVVDAQILHALIARVGVDQLADAVALVSAPWERWVKQVPALRFAVGGARRFSEARGTSGPVAWAASRIRKPQLPGNVAAVSTELLLARASTPGAASELSDELARRTDADTPRLLAAAANSGTPEERYVALRALGKRGSTEFIAAAEEFLRQESALASTERPEHRLRQGFLRYLEELSPTRTLPLAREWFCEPWPLSLAAEHILARHATSHSYSFARRRVVSAMGRCRSVDGAKSYLTEALWDCEPESRELACRSMDRSKDFPLTRIEEMASDSYEDTAVRDAARGALDAR